MFVAIIAGSDKTVASIATGQQEFHLVYIGPGNVDNPTRRVHGIGIAPCAFLPIPKGMFLKVHVGYDIQNSLLFQLVRRSEQ
jgi:Plavaka transposase